MRFRTLLAVALAGLLADASFAALPIEEAHRAYYNGHFARALVLYQHRAAAGDAEAAERAGFMFAQGPGLFGPQVPQDMARATVLLTQAARKGRAGAGFMLNMIERTD
jgi:TPR repeat protein